MPSDLNCLLFAMENQTRKEFLKSIKGKVIKDVSFRDDDGIYDVSDELCIDSIQFEDGSRLYLHASGQIGIDGIWAELE